jgi:hypothetical protein
MATSREMLATAEGKSDAERIAIDIRSFRGIAALLGAVAAESSGCGSSDCMGKMVDGIRFWVTKDQFDAVAQRAAVAENEVERLAAVFDASGLLKEDGLLDWVISADPGERPLSFS